MSLPSVEVPTVFARLKFVRLKIPSLYRTAVEKFEHLRGKYGFLLFVATTLIR